MEERTMRSSGRTITVGELIEHFSSMNHNDPVWLRIFDDTECIEELDSDLIVGPEGAHPYQEAHDLLKELQEFKGTKKDLVARIAGYP
jgi:hypothetical protein